MDFCENNGTCVKQALTYSCDCTPEFEGSLCESKGRHILVIISSSITRSQLINGDLYDRLFFSYKKIISSNIFHKSTLF